MRYFFPLVILLLATPTSTARSIKAVWDEVDRIVAIGAIDADYQQLIAVLKRAALIDEEHNWTGGKTHLVQTGDLLGRGGKSRQVMDLMIRLEAQARKEGGFIHCLLGNHEEMNLYGDLHYVSPKDYIAFRDENSEKTREFHWIHRFTEWRKATKGGGADDPERTIAFDGPYRKHWEQLHPLGHFEREAGLGAEGTYGKWIRSHNAVIKINDTLFVHAGISPKYANRTLTQLNQRFLKRLGAFTKIKEGAAYDQDGPLWYQGLGRQEVKSLNVHVETVLKHHGVRRIVIGGTLTAGTVLPRFGGRVILVHVGLSVHYGERLASLLIEKGRLYTIHRGKQLPLPVTQDSRFLQYLQQAASLDPSPSPLASLIRRMEARLN